MKGIGRGGGSGRGEQEDEGGAHPRSVLGAARLRAARPSQCSRGASREGALGRRSRGGAGDFRRLVGVVASSPRGRGDARQMLVSAKAFVGSGCAHRRRADRPDELDEVGATELCGTSDKPKHDFACGFVTPRRAFNPPVPARRYGVDQRGGGREQCTRSGEGSARSVSWLRARTRCPALRLPRDRRRRSRSNNSDEAHKC
jgi:hypothetical protein